MNHIFLASSSDKSICQVCTRSFLAHTKAATCESCGKMGECEWYKEANELLCWVCKDSQIEQVIAKANESAEVNRPINAIIAEAAEIDRNIKYNGDFYNAKTVAIVDLKKAIEADSTITNKSHELQRVMMTRFAHLKSVVFELDKQKHDAVVEQLVIGKTLRELGNDLRTEYREALKNSDNAYQPVAPVVAKPKLVKKTAHDRLIEALAEMRGCSKAEAAILIEKGSAAKASK